MKMTLQDSKQALIQLRQLWPKIKEALDGGIPLMLEIKRESKRSCTINISARSLHRHVI